MTTSKDNDDPFATDEWDPTEAIKLIRHWRKTSDKSADTKDWEDLKKALNENRMPGRLLFEE
ncbi:MAG: hypothetical protein K2X93_22845 [Candidatus Obscuribacterales bacterium]|nr:hypothetical protein [Candidatus Obscuribacterales bacterium]